MTGTVSNLPVGTFSESLAILWRKGMRWGAIIDIGCADGHLALSHYDMGLFRGCDFLNIDAQEIYRESLELVRDAIGGHYRICAVNDKEGEIQIRQGAHPYWTSLRPAGDEYWARINEQAGSTVSVPAHTLDNLVAETGLRAPYLLKLDVQGAELAVLRGAARTLTQTDVVVIEADIKDFHSLHVELHQAGFDLFDLTTLARASDQSLGWFYPVYLNRRHDGLRSRAFWSREDDGRVLDVQRERRAALAQYVRDTAKRLKSQRGKR